MGQGAEPRAIAVVVESWVAVVPVLVVVPVPVPVAVFVAAAVVVVVLVQRRDHRRLHCCLHQDSLCCRLHH